MEATRTTKRKGTKATVLNKEDKVIATIKNNVAFYHLRKGDLKLICSENGNMVLKCQNSNIETLLASQG